MARARLPLPVLGFRCVFVCLRSLSFCSTVFIFALGYFAAFVGLLGLVVGYFFLPETDAYLQRKAQREADEKDAQEKLLPSASWSVGQTPAGHGKAVTSPVAGTTKQQAQTNGDYSSLADQDDETAAILTRSDKSNDSSDDEDNAKCGCRNCQWLNCCCQRMMPPQIRNR